MSIYRQGRVNVTNGSEIIHGIGTRWLNYIKPGDTFECEGFMSTIAAVVDNHILQLSGPCMLQTAERMTYSIDRLPVVQQAETLQDIKSRALNEIDQLAGKKRMQYITSAPGQEATYLAKLEDARAYVAAGYPADSTPFVWVHAESTAVGVSAQEAADFIIYTANQWSLVGAAIERARQAAKRSIYVVTSEQGNAAVMALVQNFKTALDEI